MTYQIAYGADTESIEDLGQLVQLDLPDECADMELMDLSEYIDSNWEDINKQDLFGLDDVLQSATLALRSEGVSDTIIERVLTTVEDALTNNS